MLMRVLTAANSHLCDISISISTSTRSTKTYDLLVLTLLLVLCASSLPRARANTCAVDARITVVLMLALMS